MRLELEQMVERLATVRRPWLIATARRAGAGADAEDAVQDVLVRLSASTALPRDERSALAYAATAVRRRALDIAAPPAPAPPAPPADEVAGPADDHERRRALRAFAQALATLPERPRAVLVLDAAGWSRAAIARRLGVSERVVKRDLADHRSVVLATATAAVGGADCARLSATLATYAAGISRPRLGGPVARHLEVCDACRLALVRARALRALFPPPAAFGIGPGSTPAAPLVALKIGAAIVAAVTAAGGLGVFAHRPAPAHRLRPVAPLVAPVARATPPSAETPVQRVVRAHPHRGGGNGAALETQDPPRRPGRRRRSARRPGGLRLPHRRPPPATWATLGTCWPGGVGTNAAPGESAIGLVPDMDGIIGHRSRRR